MAPVQVVFVSNPKQKTKYQCADCAFSTLDIGQLLKHKSRQSHTSIARTNIVMKSNIENELQTSTVSELICKECGESFKTLYEVKYHNLGRHMKEKCKICGKEMTVLQLRRHKREVHTIPTHNCDQCSYKCKTNRQLKIHVKNVHSEKEFMCNICSKMFGSKQLLDYHLKGAHGDKTYHCDQCDYTTSYGNSTIRSHILDKHSTKESFICSFCEFETSDKEKLQVHKEDKHSNMITRKRSKPQKEKNHSCKICDEKFNTKQARLYHKWRVHDGIIHKCEYKNCEFQCSQKVQMKNHIQAVHLKIKVKCDFCDHQSNYKWSIQAHMRRKHSDKINLFACDKCNYRCSSKTKLRKHLTYKDRKHD